MKLSSRRRRSIRVTASLLSLGAVLVYGIAPGQSIKLPDFREELRTTTPCPGCGTVRSIRELTKARARPANPGLPSGATSRDQDVLVGAVFYHPFSKDASSYAGGVGTPEMRARFEMTSYELTIRMDDGSYRVVEQRDATRFQTGDRVRITHGRVERL